MAKFLLRQALASSTVRGGDVLRYAGPEVYEAPDAILTQTNLSGAVATVQDEPNAPDGSWMTGSGAVVLRVSFPTPGTLVPGSGYQKFRVLAKS